MTLCVKADPLYCFHHFTLHSMNQKAFHILVWMIPPHRVIILKHVRALRLILPSIK